VRSPSLSPLQPTAHICSIDDTTKSLLDYEKRGYKGFPSDEIVNL
jgi:hypothetical protein